MPLLETDSEGILSSFRGLPNGRNLGKPAQTPKEAIDRIFASLELDSQSPLKTILASWQDIVPPRFAGLSEPSDIGANTLYVRTFSSAAKQELMFEERKILASLQKLSGCAKIKKIKFL
ncbi:MAG: DUF721 domain-containing protein [Opitutales bacterium]|nr:DUF721 domain-containing protein [Opitutales bacterium]